jgi:hypothetical protein
VEAGERALDDRTGVRLAIRRLVEAALATGLDVGLALLDVVGGDLSGEGRADRESVGVGLLVDDGGDLDGIVLAVTPETTGEESALDPGGENGREVELNILTGVAGEDAPVCERGGRESARRSLRRNREEERT